MPTGPGSAVRSAHIGVLMMGTIVVLVTPVHNAAENSSDLILSYIIFPLIPGKSPWCALGERSTDADCRASIYCVCS